MSFKSSLIFAICLCAVAIEVLGHSLVKPAMNSPMQKNETCPEPDACNCMSMRIDVLADDFECRSSEDPEYCFVEERLFCKFKCISMKGYPDNASRVACLEQCNVISDRHIKEYAEYRGVLKDMAELAGSVDSGILDEPDDASPSVEDEILDVLFTYNNKRCWRTYIEDTVHVCMVCVGDVWEQVSADDYYAELNSDPFKPRIERLKAKILKIKEGWVKFKRIDGNPENKDVTSMSISKDLCTEFSKVEK